jgi:hypothetical protein
MILISRPKEMFCTTFELLKCIDVWNTMAWITLADSVYSAARGDGRGMFLKCLKMKLIGK